MFQRPRKENGLSSAVPKNDLVIKHAKRLATRGALPLAIGLTTQATRKDDETEDLWAEFITRLHSQGIDGLISEVSVARMGLGRTESAGQWSCIIDRDHGRWAP